MLSINSMMQRLAALRLEVERADVQYNRCSRALVSWHSSNKEDAPEELMAPYQAARTTVRTAMEAMTREMAYIQLVVGVTRIDARRTQKNSKCSG